MSLQEIQSEIMDFKQNRVVDLLEMMVLATASAGLLYFGYFQLSSWIWGQSLPFRPADITIWVLPWMSGRDGNELYALYVLMFADLLLVYVLCAARKCFDSQRARFLYMLLPLSLAFVFIASIGFRPSMSTFANHPVLVDFEWSFAVMILLTPILALLYFLHRRSRYLVLAVAALLLIPACFISTAPIDWYDYSFILAPALRLLHGAGISEIYFQYDLFLSLIGMAWMKLGFDLNLIQVVAQGSYYLLFLGVFAFSRQWLMDNRLSVFLLIALVLVRIYAGPGDAVHSFQLIPFRIDMWLILLVLVYFKGPYHWSTGLFCGLMLLLHNNFGIIYSAAYIQLLLTLSVIDISWKKGQAIKTAPSALRTFIERNHRNLAFILVCAIAHYLLFKNPDVPNDFNYVRLGIGFTRIATDSFYWYVVILSGLVFTLLLRLRAKVSANYLAAGFCLVYLAIGNSLYFFGRSHENGIIVLSAVFLLLFFLLLDLSGYYLAGGTGKADGQFMRKNLVVVVSFFFIASVAFCYGGNITNKVSIQAHNAVKGQFVYPSDVPEQAIRNMLSEVKTVTGNSPKVYFVGDNDFLLNYYGGFAPVGYYNPVYAWISRTQFNKFLQDLVNQGYYLVVDNGLVDVLRPIGFSNIRYINGYMQGAVVVWR
jgi:hypothetical protein